MRTTLAVPAVFPSILVLASFRSAPSYEPSSPCCQIAKDALEASRQIKPGNKRRDVEKQFEMDGGLQTAESTRYNFMKCPYIKVQIDFDLAGALEHGMPTESPIDIVTKVSVPYVAYPTAD
jgi:hypothetical protein